MGPRVWICVALLSLPASLLAQSAQPTDRPPLIDLHVHTPMTEGPVAESLETLRSRLGRIDSLNIRAVMLTGVPDVLHPWRDVLEEHVTVIPGLLFPCIEGRAVMHGRPCFESGGDWPDMATLRADIEAGRVQALGEVTTQFLGMSPSDDAFEPYFALAEEYDLPVFVHMGPAFPGVAYPGATNFVVPNYRGAAGNPLLLEDALLRHPGVRVVVVHAGWPRADEMVMTLHQYPQVYAEIGLLQYTDFFPRAEYHAFVERLVRAGFADRIVFGSDSGLTSGVEVGIDAVLEADYLTDDEKRAILCDNAARLLRLPEATCR
jgi:hypothetical protein